MNSSRYPSLQKGLQQISLNSGFPGVLRFSCVFFCAWIEIDSGSKIGQGQPIVKIIHIYMDPLVTPASLESAFTTEVRIIPSRWRIDPIH